MVAAHGYDIQTQYLVSLTQDDINSIIAWLNSQDLHFARSAVEALYCQLWGLSQASGASAWTVPSFATLLTELLLVDIITGVINKDSQGNLLISLHAIKKVYSKYSNPEPQVPSPGLYGTNLTFDELLQRLNSDSTYTAIVLYNDNHFMNITGVVRDAQGNITYIVVTNGYINGIAQTKNIAVDEFKHNFGGKVLSKEQSDYDKRITDRELMDIRGAGWWKDFCNWVSKVFNGIVKAVVKIVNYIVEPIKQIIQAIKYAAENGKWGNLVGAIATLVVGTVVSCFAAISGAPYLVYSIMSTSMSMATAICYSQYDTMLRSLAIGVASIVIQAAIGVSGILDTAFTAVKSVVGTVFNAVGSVVSTVFNAAVSIYQGIVDGVRSFGQMMTSWFNNIQFLGKGLGEGIMNFIGGIVSGGISRYVTDQTDETSNWLGKVGIGFLGALVLMPINAFSDSDFGKMSETENWFNSANEQVHLLAELQLEAFQSIASNEMYKALEKQLGEEWYCDLLRTSVMSVVNAAFGIMGKEIHEEIGYYPKDVIATDIKAIEAKYTEIAQKAEAQNSAESSEEDKTGVVLDKENKRIIEYDTQTNEITKETIYDGNGQFVEKNYTTFKAFTTDLMNNLMLPGFMMVGQGGVGVNLIGMGGSIWDFAKTGLSSINYALDFAGNFLPYNIQDNIATWTRENISAINDVIISAWNGTKAEMYYLLDGSQVGAGQGVSGKLQLTSLFEFKVGVHALEIIKIEGGKFIDDTDDFAGLEAKIGIYKVEINNKNGTWEFNAIREKNGIALKNFSEIKIGGTFINPVTGNSANGELHLKLIRLLRFLFSPDLRRYYD